MHTNSLPYWFIRFRVERGLTCLIGVLLIALMVITPLITLAWHAMHADIHQWKHLMLYVMPYAFKNTIALLIGVGLLVSILGTSTAWLVTAYRFPSHSILNWALLLPLASPAYIIAFAYLDILHPIGPISTVIKILFNCQCQSNLPDLRSIYGAIFILGFVLYPYVYLTTRAMFMTQATNLLEIARSLGLTQSSIFFRVAIPLARPAIIIGTSLALLETLNDIGVSEFLGIQTLTVSVYTTWVTRSNLSGASQISIAILILTMILIIIEHHGRRRQRYINTRCTKPIQAQILKGKIAIPIIFLSWMPVLIGFIVPMIYLIIETYKRLNLIGSISNQIIVSFSNSLIIALIVTIITLLFGLIISWFGYLSRDSTEFSLGHFLIRITNLGYAIPSTILAIGLLIPLSWIDQIFGKLLGSNKQFLMGSIIGLICANTIRFLTISAGGIEAGLARIQPSLEQASRLLGESAIGTLRRIHLPLLQPILISSAILIFLDAMKELPATLLLRPMNFETLATYLYAEAARGTYEEGIIAALAIVMAGVIPILLLAYVNLKTRL